MNLRFHPAAREEYIGAIQHYHQVNPQLAAGFVQEIEHALTAIRRNPTTWRVVDEDVRRYLVHRFPFGVYYTIAPDSITIWAVMHLSREPDYWKKRRD